jgi:hypothetical protein
MRASIIYASIEIDTVSTGAFAISAQCVIVGNLTDSGRLELGRPPRLEAFLFSLMSPVGRLLQKSAAPDGLWPFR